VRSELIKLLESLSESFEPKLSFLYAGLDVLMDALVALIIVFVPIGGRSLTGDAKKESCEKTASSSSRN
jgi:hypothetical protein